MMCIRHTTKRSQRRAVVAVLVAFALPVLFALAAVTIDVGLTYNARADLQDAADAAALGGVQNMANADDDLAAQGARRTASELLLLNKILGSDHATFAPLTDLKVGYANPNADITAWTFMEGGSPPNALSVTVHYELQYIFAGIFGLSSRNITASAIAIAPPPSTAPLVPVSLPVPGFGPIDPDLALQNPGKTGPAEPANGEYYEVGEEVVLFIYAKGNGPPAHLVLDVRTKFPDVNINKLLRGQIPPVPLSLGDEFPIVGDGTGNGSYGGKLQDRLDQRIRDNNVGNDTIIVSIIDTLPDSRDYNGNLTGNVVIVDFAAITLTGTREDIIADPNNPNQSITVKRLFGNIIKLAAGAGNGLGSTGGTYTNGSVISLATQLIR